MWNKIIIVAAILYYLHWRKKSKVEKKEVIEFVEGLDVDESIAIIRNRLHNFIKEIYPEGDDDLITEDVIELTSNLTVKTSYD